MGLIKMSLNNIKTNKTYRLLGFNNNCPGQYKNKLMALGFLPGKHFDTLRTAPFGDPVEIKINQTRLALRQHEARMLILEEY